VIQFDYLIKEIQDISLMVGVRHHLPAEFSTNTSYDYKRPLDLKEKKSTEFLGKRPTKLSVNFRRITG
jgi:hypothetical protein